jgi:hypothetical protein
MFTFVLVGGGGGGFLAALAAFFWSFAALRSKNVNSVAKKKLS